MLNQGLKPSPTSRIKDILSLSSALIVLILFICSPAFSVEKTVPTKGERENIANTETEIRILEERVKNYERMFDNQMNSIKEENVLKIERVEQKVDLYVGFFIAAFTILVFLGYKTVAKWIQQTIGNKTAEEIGKHVTKEYIQGLVKEKGESAINTLLDEFEKEAKEKFGTIDKEWTEYKNSLDALKSEKIDISRPLPEDIRKELEKFGQKLVQTKIKTTYSFDDWFYKGFTEYNQHKHAEAIESWTTAIELDPKNALAYSNRGAAYINLKKNEKAIEDCTKAIELDPKNALAYINRGVAYGNLGKHEEAIKDYKKATELGPKNI